MPAIQAVNSAQLRTLLGVVSLDIQTYIYRMNGDLVLHVSFVSSSEDSAKYQRLIELMGSSFRRMNEQHAAKAKSYRVVLVEIGPQDNMATMADKMDFRNFNLARFKAINGIGTSDQFRKLDRAKIIVQAE